MVLNGGWISAGCCCTFAGPGGGWGGAHSVVCGAIPRAFISFFLTSSPHPFLLTFPWMAGEGVTGAQAHSSS